MMQSRSSRARFLTLTKAGLVALLLVTAATVLTACGHQVTPEIQAQMDNPTVTEVGTFDGCEVKYVNRYYKENSFYIARCAPGATATVTGAYTETVGKGQVTRQKVTITTTDPVIAARAKMLQDRQAALDKLSDADRAALSIPPLPTDNPRPPPK